VHVRSQRHCLNFLLKKIQTIILKEKNLILIYWNIAIKMGVGSFAFSTFFAITKQLLIIFKNIYDNCILPPLLKYLNVNIRYSLIWIFYHHHHHLLYIYIYIYIYICNFHYYFSIICDKTLLLKMFMSVNELI
jgi:hypothetical protein